MIFVDTIIFGLLYGVMNILFLFISMSFALGLLFYDDAVKVLSNLLFPIVMYLYCILNIMIGLYGYNITGNYGDILFKRYHDKKCFYFKLEVMLSLLAASFSTGLLYLVLLKMYVITKKSDNSTLMCNIFFMCLTTMCFLLGFCLYMIHPDLFRTKRNAEVAELVRQLEAQENREVISV